jgi:GMP synthase-like glutamine amidotransferase
VKIGILKTDEVRESLVGDFGEYPEMFSRIIQGADPTIECREYDALNLEYPDDIDEVDAYLITGSKFSVYDDEEWIRTLGRFVQTLHARKKKLIGICFGHQLIAHVLGGRTEKSSEGWLIGVNNHELNAEGRAFTGSDKGFKVICSHQDQVTVPAEGSVTLAGSQQCPFAMCKIGDHILTIQGHPEFTPEYAARLYGLRREQLGNSLVDDGIESLNNGTDNALIAKWIIDFAKSEPSIRK